MPAARQAQHPACSMGSMQKLTQSLVQDLGAHVSCEEAATGTTITSDWINSAYDWYCSPVRAGLSPSRSSQRPLCHSAAPAETPPLWQLKGAVLRLQECQFIAEQMASAAKAGRSTIRSDPAYSTEIVKYDAVNKGEDADSSQRSTGCVCSTCCGAPHPGTLAACRRHQDGGRCTAHLQELLW